MSNLRIPGRRSACDRCRTQKLRCLRGDGQTTDSCLRCIRARENCVTSSSKRPGRPSTKDLAAAAAARQQISPIDLPMANVDDLFNFGPLESNYGLNSESNSLDCGDVYSHEFSMGDIGFPLSPPPSTLPTPPSPVTTDGDNYDPNGSSFSGLSDILMEQIRSLQPGESHNDMNHLYGQPPARNQDYGLLLSELYHDLSEQLFSSRLASWDIQEIMRFTCVHDDGCGDSSNASQGNLESRPLASISQRSAKFVGLLRSLQTCSSENDTVGASGSRRESQTPRPSVAHLLTTFSCYIQIISIFDSIFSHFINQSLHNPSAINTIIQSGPMLLLGGLPVPPWPNLLGHLLVCLTEHQLQPIELLMGLPDRFCVSLKGNGAEEDNHHGLFSGQNGQSLFTALIRVGTEESEDISGLGVIESLKEKIRGVKSFT
jgi:hypothetical protein